MQFSDKYGIHMNALDKIRRWLEQACDVDLEHLMALSRTMKDCWAYIYKVSSEEILDSLARITLSTPAAPPALAVHYARLGPGPLKHLTTHSSRLAVTHSTFVSHCICGRRRQNHPTNVRSNP